MKHFVWGGDTTITIYGDSLLRFVLYENGKYKINREFEKAYSERYGTELDNRSYFGSTAAKALHRMRRDAEKERPFGDHCVIEFGGNDCSYDWPKVAAAPDEQHLSCAEPDEYTENLRAMVCLAYEQGAQPILCSLPPIHEEKYLRWISRDLPSMEPLLRWSGGAGIFYRRNEYYSMLNMALAREMSLPLVDLRRGFLLERDVGTLLCEDGIHPNRKGQCVLYQAFCEFTEKRRQS